MSNKISKAVLNYSPVYKINTHKSIPRNYSKNKYMRVKRQMSLTDFQIIDIHTPPSKKESIIPHSINMGHAFWLPSKEHSVEGRKREGLTLWWRNMKKHYLRPDGKVHVNSDKSGWYWVPLVLSLYLSSSSQNAWKCNHEKNIWQTPMENISQNS